MKEYYVLAKAISEVLLDMSAEKLDLTKWLFSLSDFEYQKCARGHLGAGMCFEADGRRVSVNVENVGGHLAIQHYVEDISEPCHIRLICYIFIPE